MVSAWSQRPAMLEPLPAARCGIICIARVQWQYFVNIASDAGLMGVAGLTVYCASKAGVVNMTRAMALEIAPDVRVNCICPGYVDTDMIRRDCIDKNEDPSAVEQRMINYAPMKRIATPAEISQGVLYLASFDARFVTGAALAIDGGSTAGH